MKFSSISKSALALIAVTGTFAFCTNNPADYDEAKQPTTNKTPESKPDTLYVVGTRVASGDVQYGVAQISVHAVLADKNGNAVSSCNRYDGAFYRKTLDNAFVIVTEPGDTVLASRTDDECEIVRNLTRERIAKNYRQR